VDSCVFVDGRRQIRKWVGLPMLGAGCLGGSAKTVCDEGSHAGGAERAFVPVGDERHNWFSAWSDLGVGG